MLPKYNLQGIDTKKLNRTDTGEEGGGGIQGAIRVIHHRVARSFTEFKYIKNGYK